MRLLFSVILAAVMCMSLSSCTFLRGGDATRDQPEGQSDVVMGETVPLPDEILEGPPEAESPPEEPVEPLRLTTLYSTASLNVRSGRGTSYAVVAGLSRGEAVQAGSLQNGWHELYSDGRSVGFAHSDYLSEEQPAAPTRDGVPSASLETGLFGVSLPVGASLMDSTPLTVDADAMESYRVPMANEEIRAFFARELASLGWKSDVAPGGTAASDPLQAESSLLYRKGDLVLAVVLDGNGQRFTLTGGQR